MKRYDLIVVGGGLTGSAAAIAASRNGLKVLLVEKSGALGGAACNCLVNPFMRYWTNVDERGEKKCLDLSRGIFSEIHNRLASSNMTIMGTELYFHEEYLKFTLDNMMEEAGVQVLFHCVLCGVEMQDKKIKSITLATKSGNLEFEADYYIDATGDADLSVMAGFPYRLGRQEDNLCQPMTLCFRVGNINEEDFFKSNKDMQLLYKELQSQGIIKNPREDVLWFRTLIDGVIHFNTTRIVKLNPVDPFDVSKAEALAREQMFEIVDFLQKNVKGCENCQLLFSASEIGVRESRMICGEYVLSKEDIISCTKFDDAIAACNYEIDIHNPEGGGTSHYFFPEGEYYTIPYRALQPKDTVNLLTAGRCISSTHEAQASYRIMPTCCCLGEAAGVAVSVAKKSDVTVRDADVDVIRKILADNGAFVG